MQLQAMGMCNGDLKSVYKHVTIEYLTQVEL